MNKFYPIIFLFIMFAICLLVARQLDLIRTKKALQAQSTDEIDRAIHNSNKGVSAAVYAQILQDEDVQYSAWG